MRTLEFELLYPWKLRKTCYDVMRSKALIMVVVVVLAIIAVGVGVGLLAGHGSGSPQPAPIAQTPANPEPHPAPVAITRPSPVSQPVVDVKPLDTNEPSPLVQTSNITLSATNAANTETNWEEKIDDIVGSDEPDTNKVKQLFALFPEIAGGRPGRSRATSLEPRGR